MRQLLFIAFQLLNVLAVILSAGAQDSTPPPLLARPPTASVVVTGDEMWKNIISHPTPEFPSEARRRHLSGTGVFEVQVGWETGKVSSVTVLSSTGYPILDRAAAKTLKLWTFRPHTVSAVKLPITFRLTKKSSAGEEKP